MTRIITYSLKPDVPNSDEFVSAVTHNWDSFEKTEPEQFSRTQFIFRLKELTETILKGRCPYSYS